MPGLDVTENKIRARQHEPSLYDRNSFRTIRLTSGIKAIIGVKKGEKSTSIQSILFDKKKFTEEQAKSWLEKHNEKFSNVLELEQRKTSLFVSTPVDYLNEVLSSLTDAQLEELAKKLVEMSGPAADDNEDLDEGTSESSTEMSSFGKVI